MTKTSELPGLKCVFTTKTLGSPEGITMDCTHTVVAELRRAEKLKERVKKLERALRHITGCDCVNRSGMSDDYCDFAKLHCRVIDAVLFAQAELDKDENAGK